MIQIFYMRSNGPKKFTKPCETIEPLTDHHQFFEHRDEILSKLSVNDRVNLMWTVAHHTKGFKISEKTGLEYQTRNDDTFQKQTCIMFDCDGIDKGRPFDYIEAVASVLGIDSEHDMTVVSSGNGLHFYIWLPEFMHITSIAQLRKHKADYSRVCEMLSEEVERRGLPAKTNKQGKVDCFDKIWDHARLLRLPGSINRKETDTFVEVIQHSRTEINLDLNLISGLPPIPEEEDQDYTYSDNDYGTPDEETILKECSFLAWCQESPTDVREPQGYAALSIIGRFEDGINKGIKAIEQWTESHSLSSQDPEKKVEQAIERSGPRTCQSISLLHPGCQSCKYFGNIGSPIQIKGDTHIATEKKGFRIRHGKKSIIAYDDLAKAYKRDTGCLFVPAHGELYTHNGKYWTASHFDYAKAYAEKKIFPAPKESERVEFIGKLKSLYSIDEQEYDKLFTEFDYKINLQNGVYDIRTKKLLPHSREYGFKYILPYDYDANAKCPNYDKFLDQITLGREPIKQALLENLSACLIPGYKHFQAAFWWLQGSGANGKSTHLKVLNWLVGDKNIMGLDPSSFESSAYRFRSKMLTSTLACTIEEVNDRTISGRTLGIIKIVSDGNKLVVEDKGKPPYFAAATSKMIFTCNNEPNFEDVSPAIRRRFILVPFDWEIPENERDRGIEDKLQKEMPGIFNKVVATLYKVIETGKFLIPEETKERVQEIVDSSDTVQSWANAKIQLDPNGKISFSDLYNDYKIWNDGNFNVSKITFGKRLRGKYGKKIEIRAARVEGKIRDAVHGIKLLDSNANF